MFWVIAIVLVIASPLIVPVAVTAAHTIADWRRLVFRTA